MLAEDRFAGIKKFLMKFRRPPARFNQGEARAGKNSGTVIWKNQSRHEAVSPFAGDEVTSRLGRHFLRRARQHCRVGMGKATTFSLEEFERLASGVQRNFSRAIRRHSVQPDCTTPTACEQWLSVNEVDAGLNNANAADPHYEKVAGCAS